SGKHDDGSSRGPRRRPSLNGQLTYFRGHAPELSLPMFPRLAERRHTMSYTRFPPSGKRKVRASGRTFIPHLEALEDRSLLATLVVSPGGTVPGSFSSIQTAVNTASAGDTIQVDPGAYTEQVTINKNLTVQGNGAGAIIQAPTTLTPDAFNLRVLVEV